MKHILITGATGFIGRYLYSQLLRTDCHVVGMSQNGGEVDGHAIKSVELCKAESLEAFFNTHPIDLIFHLASAIPKTHAPQSASQCHQVNVQGTRNLLTCAKKHNVKRFVYASSYSVCNGTGQTAISEDVESPGNDYGTTKLAGEHLCTSHTDASMSSIILRYASVYGPHQEPYCVMPMFIDKVINRKPLEVWGSGKSSFDFIYVKDVVQATIQAGLSSQTGIFNIGTGIETPIITLVKTIKSLTWDTEIFYNTLKDDPEKRFSFDTTKMENELKFKPAYTLEQGIRDYLDTIK